MASAIIVGDVPRAFSPAIYVWITVGSSSRTSRARHPSIGSSTLEIASFLALLMIFPTFRGTFRYVHPSSFVPGPCRRALRRCSLDSYTRSTKPPEYGYGTRQGGRHPVGCVCEICT